MINAISKALEADMKAKGLKLDANEIYNADAEGASLKDAVLSLDFGCSGSIISDNGLVITNHQLCEQVFNLVLILRLKCTRPEIVLPFHIIFRSDHTVEAFLTFIEGDSEIVTVLTVVYVLQRPVQILEFLPGVLDMLPHL